VTPRNFTGTDQERRHSYFCHASRHGDLPSTKAHLTCSTTSLVSNDHGSTANPRGTSRSPPWLESHTPETTSPAPIMRNGKHYYTAVQLAWHQLQQASRRPPRGDHRDLFAGVGVERGARCPQLHSFVNPDEHPARAESDKGFLSTCSSIILDKHATPHAPGE
jgi:hypothetical protein